MCHLVLRYPKRHPKPSCFALVQSTEPCGKVFCSPGFGGKHQSQKVQSTDALQHYELQIKDQKEN